MMTKFKWYLQDFRAIFLIVISLIRKFLSDTFHPEDDIEPPYIVMKNGKTILDFNKCKQTPMTRWVRQDIWARTNKKKINL